MDYIRRTKQILTLLLTLVVVACSKNRDNVLPPPVNVDTTSARLKYTGTFSNGPYGSVSGRVDIYKQRDSLILALKNFNTSAGPDLHVYLSQEVQPVHFIDLGKLRQNSGDQLYAVSGSPDFNQYKYALIHCQQFNHLFGSAPLK